MTNWSFNKRFYISYPQWSRHKKMMWRRKRAKYIQKLIATKAWIINNRPWDSVFVASYYILNKWDKQEQLLLTELTEPQARESEVK